MMHLLQRARRAWNDVAIAWDSFLFGFFMQRSEDKARRGERFEDDLWSARGRGFRTGLRIALGLDTPQAREERLRRYASDYKSTYVHPKDLHRNYQTCPVCTELSFCDACNTCCQCGFSPPFVPDGYGCECGGCLDDGRLRHTRTCLHTAADAERRRAPS